MDRDRILFRVRCLTMVFILGLVLSGVTAIPLPAEITWMSKLFQSDAAATQTTAWLSRVQDALTQTQSKYPFLFYGTDWLAFGHFMIAIAFLGALRDPVRNGWLFDFGLIACVSVIPYALVFGGLRDIPLWWRLIDCSFGAFGALPLWFCRKWALELEFSVQAARKESRVLLERK